MQLLQVGVSSLAEWGRIAGLAGLALGVLMVVFRSIVRATFLPKLEPAQGFRVIRLVIIGTWTIALVGICAWFIDEQRRAAVPEQLPPQYDTLIAE